ncbi:MAG: ABC transporter ATP-binding protein [Microbacteriaceae bacterium]|nr:MAG: ABC transporter ATP-binding protein [Microbacteriaceae bacterium]
MFRAVRRSLGLLTRAELTKYIALVAGRALSGLLDVLGVVLIGVIASVATSNLGGTATSSSGSFMGVSLSFLGPNILLWLGLIVLVIFVGKSGLAIYLTRRLAYLIAAIESRNALIIVTHVLHGSLDDVKRYSKAEFQFAVTGSVSAMYTGLLNSFATIVSEGFLMVAICATFVFVSPITALFALAYFVGVAMVIQLFLSRALKRAGREISLGTIESTNVISDTLDTFRELSVMGKQDYFIGRLGRSRSRLARSNASVAFMSGMPRYIIETSLIVGVVALVGAQFLSGSLAAGAVTVGVFLAGGMRITASLLPLQNSFAQIKTQVEQSALASELLDEYRAQAARPHAAVVEPVQLPSRGVPVRMHSVSFTYPGGSRPALEGISIDVAPGEFIAVIGPSGAGKTTLVDMLLGLVAPESGTVSLGVGSPLELRLADPGLVSYVPQRPGVVSGSIAENIALGVAPEKIDRLRLAEVIKAAYLDEFIDGLPNGADTSVGKQVNSLSGGQIQRIGLARALYSRPRLLIMDEATSALDAGSEAFISEGLKRLHGEVTLVVVAHRLSTVQHADNVYVMEGGRVTAEGDFGTLIDTVPMVAEYVKLMSFDER